MKKTVLWIILAFLAGSGLTDLLVAQQGEWTEQYDRRFLNRDPRPGTEAPAVSAWDADGQPFDLAETRGNYTVLVFGCLT